MRFVAMSVNNLKTVYTFNPSNHVVTRRFPFIEVPRSWYARDNALCNKYAARYYLPLIRRQSGISTNAVSYLIFTITSDYSPEAISKLYQVT